LLILYLFFRFYQRDFDLLRQILLKLAFIILDYFLYKLNGRNPMEQNQVTSNSLLKEVSFGEWFVTILLAAIPLVNIVLLFVWAFGSNTKISKANWAKASLVWAVIGIALYLIIFVALLGVGTHFFNTL